MSETEFKVGLLPGFCADAPGLSVSEALCGAYSHAVGKMEDEGDILTATRVAAGSLLLRDGRQFRVLVDLIPDERMS